MTGCELNLLGCPADVYFVQAGQTWSTDFHDGLSAGLAMSTQIDTNRTVKSKSKVQKKSMPVIHGALYTVVNFIHLEHIPSCSKHCGK